MFLEMRRKFSPQIRDDEDIREGFPQVRDDEEDESTRKCLEGKRTFSERLEINLFPQC